jgi:hypothetical protein
MQFTSIFNGSKGTAHLVIPSAQAAMLGWREPRADLSIHQQADQVLARKQARDLREDRRAARDCGCQQCRRAYRVTRDFYATLGLRPPTRECVGTRGLASYSRHGGAGPEERR